MVADVVVEIDAIIEGEKIEREIPFPFEMKFF